MRLEGNVIANGWRRAPAHRDTHALRLLINARRIETMNTHDDTIAFLALLAGFDEAGHLCRPRRRLQHRMGDALRVQSDDAKSGRERSQTQCQRKADRAAAGDESDADRSNRQSGSRPPGRFALGGEIQRDPAAKSDR